jgi:hypothetical protein
LQGRAAAEAEIAELRHSSRLMQWTLVMNGIQTGLLAALLATVMISARK